MTVKVGFQAKLYINIARDQDAPVWAECGEIKDLDTSQTLEEIEFPCRGAGKHKQYLAGQSETEVTFDIAHECPNFTATAGEPDDPGAGDPTLTCWYELYRAQQNCQPVHLAILDGAMGGDLGSAVCGLEGTWYITGFDQSQPLNEGLTDSITLKPSVNGVPSCNAGIAPTAVFYAESGPCV